MLTTKTAGFWTLALALSGCALAADPAITAISLERDCGGCADGSRIVLRRDGQARLTLPGQARMGTVDRVSNGRVLIEDFDALARLATTGGFFSLDDEYADPQLQDGPWMRMRIERSDGSAKQVFRRHGAGPKVLDRLAAAIDAVRQRIAFTAPRLEGERGPTAVVWPRHRDKPS